MEGFVPLKGYENTHLINKDSQEIYSLLKGRILKGSIKDDGYKIYHLINEEGKVKARLLHRLVAETFIPNPNNYRIINHKNGIKTDNRVENLEWCTSSYNNKEAYRLGLRKVSSKTIEQFNKLAKNHNKGKKLSIETKEKMSTAQKKRFFNMSEEEKNKNNERLKRINIGRTPWNKGKKGLQKHTDDWKEQQSIRMKERNKSVQTPIICIETGEIFASQAEASKSKKISQGNINSCLKGKRDIAGGFHWKYFYI